MRGSISSGPGSELFPFEPLVDKYRHPEGWVNYGAAWCISLSYLAFDSAGQTTPQSSDVGTAAVANPQRKFAVATGFTPGESWQETQSGSDRGINPLATGSRDKPTRYGIAG